MDKVVTKVEIWYDKISKVWIVQCKDAEGGQIGNADYAPNKTSARKLRDEYKRKYGLRVRNNV